MKAENADDLLSYLRELHLVSPALTKQLLEGPGTERVNAKGYVYTYRDRLRFACRIDRHSDGTFETASYNLKLLEIPRDLEAAIGPLEEKFKAVLWDQDPADLLLHHLNVGALINEVRVLKENDPETAGLLMAKYWSDTPMENSPLFEYPSSLPQPKELTLHLTGDYTDLDVQEAYNLLKGRGVMKMEWNVEASPVPGTYWVVLEGGELQKLPGYDIDTQVRQLSFIDPPNTTSFATLMAQLYKGELVSTGFRTGEGQVFGLLQADPKEASLRFTDVNGHQIPLKEISGKQIQQTKAIKQPESKSAPKNKRRGHHL